MPETASNGKEFCRSQVLYTTLRYYIRLFASYERLATAGATFDFVCFAPCMFNLSFILYVFIFLSVPFLINLLIMPEEEDRPLGLEPVLKFLPFRQV